MNLTINHVRIGPDPLGWLECFIIYAWRMYGCRVDLYTHHGAGVAQHTHETLGLPPNVCNIIDLTTQVVDPDDRSVDTHFSMTVAPARTILKSWLSKAIRPASQETMIKEARQRHIYNMVDLSKSYIASTRPGIVLDLKIGPTLHLKKYVDAGIFDTYFVSFERKGTVENQCMGTMNAEGAIRKEYGRRFSAKMLEQKIPFMADHEGIHFGEITGAHINVCVLGKRQIKYFDIHKYGAAEHRKLHLNNCESQGIGEQGYGPFRLFKKESDQTNISGNIPTTEDEKKSMRDVTFQELAQASLGDGPVDVTAPGMPPVVDMLALLKKTGNAKGTPG